MDEDAEEKRREQNFIVRSGKSEAEVTISKRQRSRRRNAWANYTDRQEALRGLSATAELLVSTFVFNPNDCYMMSITTFRDNKVSCCALIFEPCEFGCF